MIRPIQELASDLGLQDSEVIVWGRDRAKVELSAIGRRQRRAKLVLVTAINPTPAGEGKTTMSLGLAMAMRKLGHNVLPCLREPSLGPVFGVKGGGTGGGKASLHPAEDINLHFTGDLHAISSAHNLLSAMIDNALHFGKSIGDLGRLDSRQISWGRTLDMNDRALRNVVVGMGRKSDGMPRQERFDITAASEVMAILALASDQEDLTTRLGRIVVGFSESGARITASDVGTENAMAALLKDALMPNLVQTLEGGPALVHAGPFANIAHGCSSLVSLKLGLESSDWVITEGGFGLDLGGEKFLNIKCRVADAWPNAVVLVATLRALKMHGGAPVNEAKLPNVGALERGLPHLDKHLETLDALGIPAVVCVNRFPEDDEEEVELVVAQAKRRNVACAMSQAFAEGGDGSLLVARAVSEVAKPSAELERRHVYETSEAIHSKMQKVARRFYGADDVVLSPKAQKDIQRIEADGGAPFVCMAKTQLSLSDDPKRAGRPSDFSIHVREVRHARGAGFAVALTGDLVTMPGLPREPAAHTIRVMPDGRIVGLMQGG